MLMKLLIGYDGSECAKAAIDDLRRAGLSAAVEAIVITAADVWLPPPPQQGKSGSAGQTDEPLRAAARAARDLAAHAMADAAALAEEGAARVRACFPGWVVTPEACPESPHWALLRRADDWRPDLIVVGSHGRSAVGRLILGSVSQNVVTHARCSVRVGRCHRPFGTSGMGAGAAATAARPAVRVLVGVDGSPESAAAVQAVAMRRWPAGSEAAVVVANDLRMATAVIDVFPPFGPLLNTSALAGPTWARRAVDRAADELREAGLPATAAVREGDPKRVLVRDAEQWGADCIFVGGQGLGRLDRFLVGSVSASVAARATCSVEVVRNG